jgi:hypothetical protein
MYKEKRNILLTGFLFLQIGLVKLASLFPNLVEEYYSRGIYPYLAGALRSGLGWLRVSVGDLVYAFLLVLLLRFVYRFLSGMIRRTPSWPYRIFDLGAAVSIFYLVFYSFWGLNYSRVPVAKDLGLSAEKYDIEKIELLTGKLLARTSVLHARLSENDSLPVTIPYSRNEILKMTPAGYKELSSHLSQYRYERPSIKKSLFSLPLTYMGFAGYLNPITGEAQVDSLIPKISFPMTSSHEVAHQLGIAYEDEANFIGFLSASLHEDPYFNYSAMIFALRYALSDIRRYDKDLFEQYLERIPPGVLANMREVDEFWKRYENPLEPLFKGFYDHYLKYNHQKDGLETYNQVMELLISFDETHDIDIY